MQRFWFDFEEVLRNEGEPDLNLNLPFHLNNGLTFPQFFDVFLCQDPRVVSRSPAERLNARGSHPSVVEWKLIMVNGYRMVI